MTILIWIIAFALAITIHEAAHAFAADKLGDPTARLSGRLSLNPIKHYDPVGTTLLLVLVIARAVGIPIIPFGWAKPVPVDPFNFKNPQKDSALVSFAGPLSNLIIAIFFSILARLFPGGFVVDLAYAIILLNVSLAIFNLVPIHPLDGGHILVGLVNPEEARKIELFLNRYGNIILIFLIFPTFGGSSIISMITSPLINFLLKILLPAY